MTDTGIEVVELGEDSEHWLVHVRNGLPVYVSEDFAKLQVIQYLVEALWGDPIVPDIILYVLEAETSHGWFYLEEDPTRDPVLRVTDSPTALDISNPNALGWGVLVGPPLGDKE